MQPPQPHGLPFTSPPAQDPATPNWTVITGDSLIVLRTLESRSIDAVISDPPYGIGFMNRTWDTFEGSDHQRTPSARFQHWTELWAQQALIASKPGANWIVAGSPQTWHRAACGLEDAGLRIVTTLLWLYGQGWPKGRRLAPGVHTALKPGWEPMLLGRAPSIESAAATFARYGTGGYHIDDCRLTDAGDSERRTDADEPNAPDLSRHETDDIDEEPPADGRWPPNVTMDREAAQHLDRETGIRRSGGFPKRRNASKAQNVYNQFNRQEHMPSGRGRTSGNASRFFYCPKAGRRERNHGLVSNDENGRSEAAPAVNDHETVKPIELMRWLVRLTTAPGATVLDPFTGSGSTGVACMLEGRSFIGIEQIPKYAEIAKRRIRRAAEDAAAASNSDGR